MPVICIGSIFRSARLPHSPAASSAAWISRSVACRPRRLSVSSNTCATVSRYWMSLPLRSTQVRICPSRAFASIEPNSLRLLKPSYALRSVDCAVRIAPSSRPSSFAAPRMAAMRAFSVATVRPPPSSHFLGRRRRRRLEEGLLHRRRHRADDVLPVGLVADQVVERVPDAVVVAVVLEVGQPLAGVPAALVLPLAGRQQVHLADVRRLAQLGEALLELGGHRRDVAVDHRRRLVQHAADLGAVAVADLEALDVRLLRLARPL